MRTRTPASSRAHSWLPTPTPAYPKNCGPPTQTRDPSKQSTTFSVALLPAAQAPKLTRVRTTPLGGGDAETAVGRALAAGAGSVTWRDVAAGQVQCCCCDSEQQLRGNGHATAPALRANGAAAVPRCCCWYMCCCCWLTPPLRWSTGSPRRCPPPQHPQHLPPAPAARPHPSCRCRRR